MKKHPGISARQEAAAERALFQAVLTLRSVDECRAFFRDLCTPAELQALADRWTVVGLLQANEAIKLVLGQGQSLSGRLLIYDALRSIRKGERQAGLP